MEEKLLKDLKVGDWFTLKPVAEPSENIVWVRDAYDRGSKKYSCYKWSDVNHESLKNGNTKVYIGFTF